MKHKNLLLVPVLSLLIFISPLVVSRAASVKSNKFIALCMDTHDSKKRTISQQAELLKELGYDGIGHLWLEDVPLRIRTLDAVGLKLLQLCVRLNISAEASQPYNPELKKVVPLLKDHKTTLVVLVSGGKPSDATLDERAVKLLRVISELAEESGLKVALYPHTNDWLESMEDALRVADKVDRENVGVMFNLCHWLRVDKQRNYERILKKAIPKLFAISINGADEFDDQPGWGRYIQPLGKGSFGMFEFLKTLQKLNYSEPVALQCYGIGGDVRITLEDSMKAWKKYLARLDD